jgi:hypothetical protein
MKALTTLVAAVGNGMGPAVGRLSSATNVSVVHLPEIPDEPVTAMATAANVWRDAARRSSIYTVVAMDPLALAIGLVADVQTPDYYLVAPDMPDPQVHWYMAHVRSLAPSRLIVCQPHPSAIAGALADLPFGKALPSLSELANSARGYVPLAGELEAASEYRRLGTSVNRRRRR